MYNKLIKTLLAILLILIIVDYLLITNISSDVQKYEEYVVSSALELPSIPPEPEYIVVSAKVTAYAPHDNKSGICNNGNPNTTATGTYPKKGVAAVDPRKIPYGTKMYIPDYGHAIAEDTGGALRKYEGIQIDIVMDTYEEAIKWGVRYLDVRLEV